MRRYGLPLGAFLLVAVPSAPQGPPPSLPPEEVVRHFAAKEAEYARAHALYRYELSVKIQEIGEDQRVLGEFEQRMQVDFDASGRRRAHLLGNPRSDLRYLELSRLELTDFEFVPLFVLAPEQIPDYDVRYLSRERIDEVDTFLFRLEPNRPLRPGERFFEGVVWVDAEKLDIVRAHGRSRPTRPGPALKEYFQYVEVFREPVDDYLFPTYVRADDVLSVRDVPVRARLILRFRNHQRISPSASP